MHQFLGFILFVQHRLVLIGDATHLGCDPKSRSGKASNSETGTGRLNDTPEPQDSHIDQETPFGLRRLAPRDAVLSFGRPVVFPKYAFPANPLTADQEQAHDRPADG